MADENFLLRIALDVEHGFDSQQPRVVLEFLHKDSYSVGKFVVQRADGFLADDFGGEKPFGLIGDLVFREKRLALRQMAKDFI